MALRRVFSQDSDFKEKMFARQIAVMKGQAWNVVETLKTLDHGPLELTRRSRVCVWDDLVDIPVAIPMRVPSAEMRLCRDSQLRQSMEEEEMDISAANGPAPVVSHDLLGISSPVSELPNPNRFDLSRNTSTTDLTHYPGVPDSPLTVQRIPLIGRDMDENKDIRMSTDRPPTRRSKSRASYQEPGRTPRGQRRRYSHSVRYDSSAFLYDGDDLEGDLGYAVAEGMEKSQRKVIVERLETVKSKNPVFTWC